MAMPNDTLIGPGGGSGASPAGGPASETILDGRYRMLNKIGEGGMGEVWVAEHVHLEKKVAIKLLRPEILTNREAVARFRQEARSASSIGHENIINIDDFGTLPDGRVYMAMEWLQGQPLDAVLKSGALTTERALEILIQTGKGLAAAHAKGITHRDMKPENVFVTAREGRDLVKILDFGIAKVAGDAGGGKAQTLTIAGTIFGTPQYMAPEQAMGSKVDHRVDVYAMGIILYEVFCGRVPFVADTFMGVLSQHITSPPPPPAETAAAAGRKLPPGVAEIILTALAKEPAQRQQTMAALVGQLTDVYRKVVGPRPSGPLGIVVEPTPRSKPWKAIAASLSVFAIAGIAWKVLSNPSPPVPPQPPVIVEQPKPPVEQPKPPIEQPKPPVEQPKPPVVVVQNPPENPPVENPPPIVVKTTRVTITSKPAGATVWAGGHRLGVTPYVVDVKAGEPRKLRLVLDGYHEKTITVDDSKGTVNNLLVVEGLLGPEDGNR
jgi:serine/threonine-protein kinase